MHELCITSYNGGSLDISHVKFEFDIVDGLKLYLKVIEYHSDTQVIFNGVRSRFGQSFTNVFFLNITSCEYVVLFCFAYSFSVSVSFSTLACLK